MEPRKGRDGGAKHGFSWGGMGRVGYRTGSLDGKWLNVRWLHKCARMAFLDAGWGAVGNNRVDFGEGC